MPSVRRLGVLGVSLLCWAAFSGCGGDAPTPRGEPEVCWAGNVRRVEAQTVICTGFTGMANRDKAVAHLRDRAAAKGYALAGMPMVVFPSLRANKEGEMELQWPLAQGASAQRGDAELKHIPASDVLGLLHTDEPRMIDRTYDSLAYQMGMHHRIGKVLRHVYWERHPDTGKAAIEVQLVLED